MTDFLLVTEKRELAPGGQLGISMEKGSQGVRIQELQAGGGAAEAGLQQGDQVVELDGQAVLEPADIRIALLDKRPGGAVNLVVSREREAGVDERCTVTVRLSAATP